jgi:hypothetical protein
MSEKLEQRPQRPAASESGAKSDIAQALTPAERAERELAKMDEEMDAILDRKPNRAALVNSPGQALQPPEGRTITPSVSAPLAAKNINHLVLNCIVPGLGSLAHGNYAVGAMQLGMAVAAIPTLLFVKFWLALLLAVMAYVWSLASGLRFLNQVDVDRGVWK